MAFQEVGGNFKVNAANIKIDPSHGIVDQGIINIPASEELENPSGPAIIGSNQPMARKKQFFNRKPGATLAEQLGTPEAVQEHAQEPYSTQPINVPTRIPPPVHAEMKTSALDMERMLTPRFEKQEAPAVDPAPTQPEPSPETTTPPLKADLKGLVLRYVQKIGVEKAAKFFGKSEGTVSNWAAGRQEPTLSAAQLILDRSPKAQQHYLRVLEKVDIDWETGEGSFQREYTKEEFPLDLCLAVKGDIPPYVHWVFTTAAAQYGVGQKMFTDTIITRSRNMLADLFLKGKAEWSLWLDADCLPTIGNAMWWKAIVRDTTVSDKTMSYDFIKRMLSHKIPFVGGVYSTRRKNGPLVIQPDLHPRGNNDKSVSDQIRKNKAEGLLEVDWLSIGFCLVNRVVFETIKQKHPELQPKLAGEPYPFFTPTSNEGEDVRLSTLAKDSGFKLYLDCELFAAHIGRYAYVPSESQFNGVLEFTNF